MKLPRFYTAGFQVGPSAPSDRFAALPQERIITLFLLEKDGKTLANLYLSVLCSNLR